MSERMRFRKFTWKALMILMAVVWASVYALPQSLYAQDGTFACAEVRELQPGESLAGIAANALGTQDAVADIIAATNAMAAQDATFTPISDPNLVGIGWKICVPVTDDDARVMTIADSINLGEGDSFARADVASRGQLSFDVDSDFDLDIATVELEKNGLLMEQLISSRLSNGGLDPLSIDYLRSQAYPGSALTVEQTLSPGSNYSRYLVSYQSEGLKIYALLTVPNGTKPASGWPVILFNHGYIDPQVYSPTERYMEYVDAFASNGYIVLRPDLRGHGDSDGVAYGAYGDPGYTIDVLNALASIQQYADADPERIGMWGHSMGGYLTARAMVVSDEIRAGVIWAGVVGTYEELVSAWDGDGSTIADGEMPIPQVLSSLYGGATENGALWTSLSANSYASDLSGPVQLHHGTQDADVPVAFSDSYYADVIGAGQRAEYYVYAGDDHNISANFDTAMRRTLEFFDTYVKNWGGEKIAVQG